METTLLTPPPANPLPPSQRSTRMVELPLEMIQRILTVCLPVANSDPDDFERSNTLLLFSRIHSSLTPFAQRLLFSHPLLVNPQAMGRFIEIVQDNVKLAEWVKFLTINIHMRYRDKVYAIVNRTRDPDKFDTSPLIEGILDVCGRIEEFSVSHLPGVNFAFFARARSKLSASV